jgi:hypothetical protein
MILRILQVLMPLPHEKVQLFREPDDRYWWGSYFIRVFEDSDGYGYGWQIFRDNKFIYRNGEFVALVDGGFCTTRREANYQAQDYVDECLDRPEEA